MELYICIVVSIIIVLAILGIIIIANYNKYQLLVVKIKAAENNIGILLREKYETYDRIINVIEDKIKINDEFEDLHNIDIDRVNNFDLEILLNEYSNKINGVIDINDKLNDNEVINDLKRESINSDLDSKIKYYNDNVILYNNLVKCFPSNIIAKMYRFREKEFYQQKD